MRFSATMLSVLLALLPVTLSAQQARERTLRPLSCAGADSLLGPLPDDSPTLHAFERKGDPQVWIGVDPLDRVMPQIGISISIPALPGPPEGYPLGTLAVFISGDSAKAFNRAESPPAILLVLDDSLQLTPSQVKKGTVRGGTGRLYPLTVGLSPAVLRALVVAGTADVHVGGVTTTLVPTTMTILKTAYRTAVCGYGHL